MPHLDEGQIQAYLDRQLEYADEAARLELENHVAECPACADLMEDVRTIRGRANSLLRASAPSEVSSPPFEQIVERARSGDAEKAHHGARIRRLRVIAWAASVIMAVGLGVYARPYILGPVERELGDLALDAAQPLALDSQTPGLAPAVSPQTGRRQREEIQQQNRELAANERSDVVMSEEGAGAVQGAEPARTEPSQAAPAAPAELARARQRRIDEVSEREEEEAPELRQQDSTAVRGAGESLARKAADAAAGIVAGEVERDALEAGRAQPVAEVSADFDDLASASINWRAADQEAAETFLDARPVIVAGIAVSQIDVATVDGGPVVRVTQVLDGGGVLELIERQETAMQLVVDAQDEQRPVSAAVAERAPEEPGALTTVTVRFNGYVVTARANLPADSLRTLLGQLRSLER